MLFSAVSGSFELIENLRALQARRLTSPHLAFLRQGPCILTRDPEGRFSSTSRTTIPLHSFSALRSGKFRWTWMCFAPATARMRSGS